MSWTLMTPLVLIFSSFIIYLTLSSIYTYWLLLSSLVLYIPAGIISVSIQIFGGYKMLLQNRIKNIQSKIEKLESAETQKNKSIDKSERIFLRIEQRKHNKTWDDVLYTEEEIKQYMQMPESSIPFNHDTIFETNEQLEETNDFINDGIDGMPFPNSPDTNKVSVLTKKLVPRRNIENK